MFIRAKQVTIYSCFLLVFCMIAHGDIDSLLAPMKDRSGYSNDSYGKSKLKDTRNQKGYVFQNQIIERLQSIILSRFQKSGDLTLRPDRNWKPIPIENDQWSVRLINVTPNKIASRMVVHFRLNSGSQLVGNWQIPVQAELWVEAFQLARPIKRGESIQRGDVNVVTVNALKHQNPLILATEDIEKLEIYQTINMDYPLYWKNVRATPMIRKGQIVDVLAKEGSLRISTKGLAMQDGSKGELITIRNIKSKKDFQAQVINENSAKVFF